MRFSNRIGKLLPGGFPSGSPAPTFGIDDLFGFQGGNVFSPSIFQNVSADTLEIDEDNILIQMSLPGISKDHVKLYNRKDILVVEWDPEDEKAVTLKGRKRWSLVKYHDRVHWDGVKAGMKDGVLRISIPLIDNEPERNEIPIE